MEFSLTRDVFLGGVQRTLGVVDRRTTMPILNNVLIKTDGDKIKIVATDREIGLIADYEAKVVKDGEITVAARKLFEILREIQGETVQFRVDDSNWIRLACGKSTFRIAGMPAEEFPRVLDDEGIRYVKVKGSVLSNMISQTFFAMSLDETRISLNGVFLRTERDAGKIDLNMIATDGHRLAMVSVQPVMESSPELEQGIIIPRKGVNEIRKLVDDGETEIEFGAKKGICVLKKNNVVLKVSLIDAEYPDYKRVIPKDKGVTVELEKDAMIHALRRMSVMSSERYSGVKIKLSEDRVVLNSTNPDVGEAQDEIEAAYREKETEVGFNVRYLLEGIEAVHEKKFILEVRNGLRPAVVKPMEEQRYICVIMPLKI
ncbi:MAG TPA: DNA polymerase III subunit beta [Syntrophales bacterium]|nr:DNA polymerase III subunit beta [Syntrophales bacterium]HRT61796.1 DNA polymerase III subunit beta [Syntrophales bacterium]